MNNKASPGLFCFLSSEKNLMPLHYRHFNDSNGMMLFYV